MSAPKYNPERDVRTAFMTTVATWLAASGEVLVILRYLYGAGSKGYSLCRTTPEFEALVNAAPLGADIEVFRQPQLPLRGVVTDAFIARALSTIEDGAEFMVVSQEREFNGVLSTYGESGDTHDDLRAILEGLQGQEVATGPCPDFTAADGPDLISASKGGIDGPR